MRALAEPTVFTNFRLTPATHAALQAASVSRGQSMNSIVESLLAAALVTS